MRYQIHYSNAGRPEHTGPQYTTLEEAQEAADFLRLQGAKRVRIKTAEHFEDDGASAPTTKHRGRHE